MAAEGDFVFTFATITGDAEITDGGQGIRVLVTGDGPGDASGWDLAAERLVVNWTNVTRDVLVHPAKPGSQLVSVDRGAPRWGERPFMSARVVSSLDEDAARLLVVGSGGESASSWHQAAAASIRAQPAARWQIGPSPHRDASGSGPDAVQYSLDVPPGLVQSVLDDGTLTVAGSLSLVLWQANVTVTPDAGPDEEFTSGTSGEDAYADPIGGNALARTRVDQLLVIRAENATLRLRVNSSGSLVAAETIAATGRMNATFRDANGAVTAGAAPFPLSGEDLTIDGILRLQARGQAGSDTQLKGAVSMWEGSVRSGSREIRVAPGDAAGVGRPAAMGAAIVLFMLAAATVPAWAVVRTRTPTIDAVEWALLGGRPVRAQRLATRLAAAQPRNADAVFLLGATLLSNARYTEAIRRVEPLAEALAPAQRSGIALVLAVAAEAVGDRHRELRWAKEAAREPLLAGHVQAGVGDPEAPPQQGRNPAPIPGYA